jgi:hypothetical protein
MTCPLCRQRKAKRSCPGVGQEICPVCCGTKRLVEIACPSTCIYLEAAQRHPAAVVKRQQESDLTVLMGALGRVSERQLQLFFLIQSFVTRYANKAGSVTRLVDSDVAEAAGALAASFETASRGVLYEHQAGSPAADALRRELKDFLEQIGRGAGARFEREAAEVLRGIERAARHDTPGIGAGVVDYLSLAARILQERPPDSPPASSLIIP